MLEIKSGCFSKKRAKKKADMVGLVGIVEQIIVLCDLLCYTNHSKYNILVQKSGILSLTFLYISEAKIM